MSEAVEVHVAEPKELTNAQLTQELAYLRRINNELQGQVQNLSGRMSKLDRDIRAIAVKRR
jgi:hypothetical protein